MVGHCYLQYRIVEQHGLVWDRRERHLPLDNTCFNQLLITDTALKMKSQLARTLFSYRESHSSYLQRLRRSVFGEGYIHPADFRGKHDFTLPQPGGSETHGGASIMESMNTTLLFAYSSFFTSKRFQKCLAPNNVLF